MSRKYDLSVLITARNEEFLKNTVEDICKNKRGNTEIIVGLDEKWSNPPLVDHPDVTIYHSPVALGQRGMLNQLCRLSQAKYVMKIDAHCAVDEGFDVKMMDAFKEVGDDVTMVPTMYNLHCFDWKCMKCGKRTYQGRTPLKCDDCDNIKDFKKKIVWQPRWNRKTESWRFDSDLHFQYWYEFKNRPEFQSDIVPTMSLIGACFMLTRDRWWYLNICDEKHGSWGQQGTEIACKSWLSGGKLLVNKRTWFAHMFRTQGGDFGFPYPNSQQAVNKCREYSRDIWFNNKFDKQKYPLSWLIELFWPIPGWDQKDLDRVKELGNKWQH